jgi:hypothetical protein
MAAQPKAAAPQPRRPGTFTVTSASVGTVIDTNGSLVGVALTTPPGAREPFVVDQGRGGVPISGRFCLIDDSGPAGSVPRVLYNADPYVGGILTMNRPAGSGIPFGALRVASCPAHAVVTVTTV